MTPAAWTWLAAAEPITRDGARDAAVRELRDPAYRTDDQPLLVRLILKVLGWLARQFDRAVSIVPGGFGGLAVLLLVLVGVVVLVVVGRGVAAGRRDALTDRRAGSRTRTAAEYRAAAERLAAAGDFREAVRERFRALIRELEQRGVLDPRPGRTAGEVAAEGGYAVPVVARDLRTAAGVFDEIWYGGRDGTPAHYAQLREIDDRVRNASLATAVR